MPIAWKEEIVCIVPIKLRYEDGKELCLAHKWGVSPGAFSIDGGYVLGIVGDEQQYHAMPSPGDLAAYQAEGLIPKPLPAYSWTFGQYAYAHYLSAPILLILLVVAFAYFLGALGSVVTLRAPTKRTIAQPKFDEPVEHFAYTPPKQTLLAIGAFSALVAFACGISSHQTTPILLPLKILFGTVALTCVARLYRAVRLRLRVTLTDKSLVVPKSEHVGTEYVVIPYDSIHDISMGPKEHPKDLVIRRNVGKVVIKRDYLPTSRSLDELFEKLKTSAFGTASAAKAKET